MTKRNIRILGAASLMLILSACALFGSTQSSSGDEFHVGIDSPSPGETLSKGPIEIVYFGSSSAGISKVELSINNEVVQNIESGGPKHKCAQIFMDANASRQFFHPRPRTKYTRHLERDRRSQCKCRGNNTPYACTNPDAPTNLSRSTRRNQPARRNQPTDPGG